MKSGRPSKVSQVRLSSGDIGLDAVLGSGFAQGTLTILHGPAGIGKTSLLMGVAISVATRTNGRVIWLSNQEDTIEFKAMIRRICGRDVDGVRYPVPENLEIKTDDNTAFANMTQVKLVVVDCLPSSRSKIVNMTTRLGRLARSSGTVVAAIGHSTKDRTITCHNFVRHEADTILAMEPIGANPDGTWTGLGSRSASSTHWSQVRTDGKNRRGDPRALAVYRMTVCGPIGIASM